MSPLLRDHRKFHVASLPFLRSRQLFAVFLQKRRFCSSLRLRFKYVILYISLTKRKSKMGFVRMLFAVIMWILENNLKCIDYWQTGCAYLQLEPDEFPLNFNAPSRTNSIIISSILNLISVCGERRRENSLRKLGSPPRDNTPLLKGTEC